uniref:Uncharacterized protein n=1 Tax=Siphoviridae sp. ctBCr48 TaxID=2827802 RepID=A0A8S5SHI9_9CAUD|nr:MAG TPA: hypothetical protein [Siphoviridae sp. ctBCr48]
MVMIVSPLFLYFYFIGQGVSMEVYLVFIRAGKCSGNVFDYVECVIVEVDVILFVRIFACLNCYNKFIIGVVGDVHTTLHFKDDVVCTSIVDGYFTLTLEVTCLLGKVLVDYISFRPKVTTADGHGGEKGGE